jgi:preprotein translocase subunit SecE
MEKNQKKDNAFVRFGKKIAKICKDTVGELKKVVWLSKSELVKSSKLVVIAVIVVSVAIAIVDLGFSQGINFLAGLIG